MKKVEQSEFKSVAKRYAQALLELCDSNSISKETILKELNDINESIKGSDELSRFMQAPSISKDDKKNIINKIFKNINKVTKNFLLYLIEKDRFNILETILYEFQAELNKSNNFVQIEIVSAVDISSAKRNSIKERLSKKLNKQVDVEWSVDTDIIGGLIFIIDDSIIDTSIKSKLQSISRNIIK